MKILIQDIIPGDPAIPYKFLIEDSSSVELERICRNIEHWKIDKRVVIIITIDENNRSLTDTIVKTSRDIIRSVKGTDYLDECISTVKYKDLSRIKRHEWI